MTIHQHGSAADGTVLVGQVKAVLHAAVGDELAVLALGAAVVGRQAVHLRDTREVGHCRRTDRAAAAHLVAARVGKGHQLDRDDVQHRVPVAADGVQLLLQPLPHQVGQGVAVVLFGALPGGVPQLLLRPLDAGGVGAPRDGPDVVVDHGRHLVGVGDDDLPGFFGGQVVELGQHILGGAVVEGRLVVGVLVAAGRLHHRAVDRVLRLLEMDVAGGDHRLVQVLPQPDDGAVEVFDPLDAVHAALPDHVFVVAQRLHFQQVVIGGDLFQLLVGAALHHGAVQLAGLAGRGDDEPFAVLVQQAAGHPRLFEKVVQMGLADDLVQVFQSRLVLDQQDDVVVFFAQHLPVAAKAGVDAADVGDLLFLQITEHNAEDAAQSPGVLTGTVGLVGGQLQVLVDGALLIVVQAGVHGLGHGQGVDVGGLKLDAAAPRGRPQKADVEAVGVVGYQHPAPGKVQKGLQGLPFCGGVGHHLVGDAGQLGDLGGDGLGRLDKGVELVHHLAVPHQHRADLGQVLAAGVEAGGLGVKDAELPLQGLVLHAVDAGDHVVHKIGLAAVDQLEGGVFLVDVVGGQHGLGVALADPVVGDGDGGVPHLVGQPDDAAGVAEAVQRRELGVQVQFHPLFGGVVLPAAALHDQHVVGVDDVVVLVLVVGAVAPHQQGGAVFQPLPLGAVLPFLGADLQVDGAGIVGDGDGIDLAEIALDLGGKDVAPNHALAALAPQVFEGGQVFGLEHLAVEDLDRLVGQVEPLHLQRRRGAPGLELDHRRGGFFFQFLFQLAALGLAGGRDEPHRRALSGVGLDAVGQQVLKFQVLQKAGAVAGPHRDLFILDGQRAPVEKAVDGHTIPLHLLEDAQQGLLVQGGVGVVVFDRELVALIIGLQGRQKPRTQALVQRRGTLQGKDHLLPGPQHQGVFHHHLAETGGKVRVCHELGPQLGYQWFQIVSPSSAFSKQSKSVS